MARYKPVDYAQGQFISVQFDKQILPGTFEHTLSYVVDKKLDFTAFDLRRKNDGAGAPAYDPRVMLKIVLFAYAHGVVSSREIEAACQQNIVMMALSANTRPHFTTVAQFVRELGPDTEKLFVDVLLYCDELGLIGREMFAVDGCKFPSNASKEWSGTRADFEKRRAKLKETVDRLVKKHRDNDDNDPGRPGTRDKEKAAVESLESKIAKIDRWLIENPEDRKGVGGAPVKSSITDPDSAKMASSRGVIQGYNGLAMVDGKNQVIVAAQAFGRAHEAELLEPMLDRVQQNFRRLGDRDIGRKVKLLADTGFHSRGSLQVLSDRGVDAYVPDNRFRQRNSAFDTAGRHRSQKALIGRSKADPAGYFTPKDFSINPANGKLTCPAGKELYISTRRFRTPNGYYGTMYKSKVTDCRTCEIKARCLRNPGQRLKTVHKFEGRDLPETVRSLTRQMMEKIDSSAGRFLYSCRMGIVEPVFANVRHMLGLARFTLRGRVKVNAQWTLFSIVHNLGKIQRQAWAGAG